ncbi:MAG: 30S ribosomal protein S11 [Candidatus Moranbacteria bacterium GW2011_GWC2_37_8]|nr:MAG: 30S ribosomal protein S11 [Candidatus Moranbacteria bacterium GW2011_GWC2_37_8]KKQ62917.1 MAG: 30S ribosomal protein S11 [Parcubacteria group bacterium GW2011_GWC1_38_22]KKQ81236.1 MAG: 30S ribosomal protein S11 [Candidatus Moranbacteria bacterium GW2011_GWD2_38_7]
MAEEIKTTEEIMEQVALETGGEAPAAVAVEGDVKKKKKKLKRQINKGQAHIKCTYNNTMVMISDANGAMLAWSSSGLLGFKGAKKATPYAATQVVHDVSEKVKKFGVQELDVFVRGVGSGRESSIRSLANKGFELTAIKDVTPIPHNGCRPKKPRRV